MIFQYGLEPVLIQRLIGFEVIMDISSVLGRGMRELKIGDRFWYENAGMKNSFNPGKSYYIVFSQNFQHYEHNVLILLLLSYNIVF